MGQSKDMLAAEGGRHTRAQGIIQMTPPSEMSWGRGVKGIKEKGDRIVNSRERIRPTSLRYTG